MGASGCRLAATTHRQAARKVAAASAGMLPLSSSRCYGSPSLGQAPFAKWSSKHMNSERFLFVLGGDPKKWALRFGLEPFSASCDVCGTELTTSLPFAYESLRGLRAPECGCGNVRTPYCVVRDQGSGDLFKGKEVPGPRRPVSTRTPSRVPRR